MESIMIVIEICVLCNQVMRAVELKRLYAVIMKYKVCWTHIFKINIPYRTKVRRTKFSTLRRNFDTFVRILPDFSIETLDKIFDGQNFSSDKTFDTKPKFRQFCPTNFCCSQRRLSGKINEINENDVISNKRHIVSNKDFVKMFPRSP